MRKLLFVGIVLGGSIGIIIAYLAPAVGLAEAILAGVVLGAALSIVVPSRSRAENRSASNVVQPSLRLHEEVLDIRKEQVQTGEVTVRREVVEEQRTIHVPVHREEVVIEIKHDDPAVTGDRHSETIRIPVKEERVDVVTYPVDLEAVEVTKRRVEDTQQIKETLKHEEVRVELLGEPEVKGDSFDDARS
jgi:uncharacterized protein (TIGR02271 family)